MEGTKERRINYHHWQGYTDGAETEVVGLCPACHHDTHRGKIPEVRTGRVRDDARDVTPYDFRLDRAADAMMRGETWAPNVPGAAFDALHGELIALGLGSLRDGITRWREDRGVRRVVARMAERVRFAREEEERRVRWLARRDEWRREETQGATAFAEAVARLGSVSAARLEIGRPVPQKIRRLAREILAAKAVCRLAS